MAAAGKKPAEDDQTPRASGEARTAVDPVATEKGSDASPAAATAKALREATTNLLEEIERTLPMIVVMITGGGKQRRRVVDAITQYKDARAAYDAARKKD